MSADASASSSTSAAAQLKTTRSGIPQAPFIVRGAPLAAVLCALD
jgi:hypothetical protein